MQTKIKLPVISKKKHKVDDTGCSLDILSFQRFSNIGYVLDFLYISNEHLVVHITKCHDNF